MQKIDLYNDSLINKYINKYKRAFAIFIFVTLLSCISYVLTYLLCDRDNMIFIEIVFAILNVILTFISLYILINVLMPLKRYKNHVILIKRQKPNNLPLNKVIEVSTSKITLSSKMKCYEIKVIKNDNFIKVYYLSDLFDPSQIEIGKLVSLDITSSYIVGYSYEE